MATPATQLREAIYSGFDRLPIGGRWRKGRSATVNRDHNPWNGDVLLEIPQASREDLNDAYSAAAEAQRSWGAWLPGDRAAVMRRAAAMMDARHDEIVGWLVRESGSTQLKATLEWEVVHGVLRPPYYLETNIPGLFAAGDVRHGSVKRCASAVGEGAMAVTFVQRYFAGG